MFPRLRFGLVMPVCRAVAGPLMRLILPREEQRRAEWTGRLRAVYPQGVLNAPEEHAMKDFNPAAYGPVIGELLGPERLPALAVDPPYRALRAQLEVLEDDDAFAPLVVRDRAMASACRAALWLFFDFLDEAHAISQDLHTVEGSYWHALVHRREPDYENSKYWFRKVGVHPVFARLHQRAAQIAGAAPRQAGFLTSQARWEPMAFVDLCETAAEEAAPCHELCRQVQLAEWQLLFDWCHRQAVGAPEG